MPGTALARNTDPATSHLAAAGGGLVRETHCNLIKGLLRKNPGSTYQELYASHVAASRRLRRAPEIKDAPSLMRRLRSVAEPVGQRECRVSHRRATTWQLAEGAS